MDKKNSTGVGGTGKAEQASVIPKGAVPRRQANTQVVQNGLLIWLDKSIDDNDADCRDTIIQLEDVLGTINTFSDTDQCVDFLTDNYNEKAVMIISGTLCQSTVPLIHDIDQLDAIFVLCRNRIRYEQWAKDWPKIKGLFTEIAPICDAIEQAAQPYEQNSIAISFMATTGDMSTKNLDQLDCSFMYTLIMKEILLSIQFEQNHIQEFIDYCRDVFADNKEELINVKELERKYHRKAPIWWYTREYFLSSMLDRALRLMDVDLIIKMGFFIGDLHRHIEQLYFAQLDRHHLSATFTVYRGQGLSRTDFEKMKNTNGGLMSFNSFLSTSKDRSVSLAFTESNLSNPDLIGILFIIFIDPSISTTPFASVADVSYFQDEDEIVFSMNTVFRIRGIKPMGESRRLFQVGLALTSDNDPDLRALTDRIRDETERSTGWDQLGKLLLKMGHFDKAEQVYGVILEQTTNESEKATIYYYLGRLKNNQSAYEEAIPFYEKALEIDQKRFPPNHPDLAVFYTNIGNVYYSMSEYSKALSYYKKDLEISQKVLSSNHPDLAKSYNNIGNVYSSMSEYSKALSCYEKTLAIQQRSLPPNHSDLAAPYDNIGNVYDRMREYSKALSYYEQAHGIRQQSLPPNHPDLSASYNNIGTTYAAVGDYSKARWFCERAVDIAQHSLPSNHPDLQGYTKNLKNIKKKL